MSKFFRRLRRDTAVHAFLLLPNASVAFLLYYLVSNALKPKREFYRSEFALPESLSFEAIAAAIRSGAC